jgi:hypothetical protein
MDANKVRILFDNQTKFLNIPLEQSWDMYGQQLDLEKYEEDVLEKILNPNDDFEVTRFDHQTYDVTKTSINYDFYLYQQDSQQWLNSYQAKFSTNQIYYFEPPFDKSFWKIDFYDSPTPRTQKSYFTVILPVQQGLTQATVLNNTTPVTIRRPKYVLDYIGDKEGFFLYWLKGRGFLNINTFYMTAKFFDGSTGQFIKMMNTQQNLLPNMYDFPPESYFYYKVDLDYLTQTYQVFNYPTGNRAGTVSNPIKWYEYTNP